MSRRYHMVDSYSDGMCGFVEANDLDGSLNTVRVRWSIDSDVTSQEAARTIAYGMLDDQVADRMADQADRLRDEEKHR